MPTCQVEEYYLYMDLSTASNDARDKVVTFVAGDGYTVNLDSDNLLTVDDLTSEAEGDELELQILHMIESNE